LAPGETATPVHDTFAAVVEVVVATTPPPVTIVESQAATATTSAIAETDASKNRERKRMETSSRWE
jgi:hypothetical protein